MSEMRRKLGSRMQWVMERLECGYVLTKSRRHYLLRRPDDGNEEGVPDITMTRLIVAGLIIDDPVFGLIASGKPWRSGFYRVPINE